jgi:hypothetical protein
MRSSLYAIAPIVLSSMVALTSEVYSQDAPTPTEKKQWKGDQDATLFDLVSNGYKIVGYSSSNVSGVVDARYLLQKDATVYQCYDLHVSQGHVLLCEFLVAPY